MQKTHLGFLPVCAFASWAPPCGSDCGVYPDEGRETAHMLAHQASGLAPCFGFFCYRKKELPR